MALKANDWPERSSSRQRSRASLDDFALVLGRFDVEFVPNVVERDHGKVGTVRRQPGVLAAAGKPDITVTVQR